MKTIKPAKSISEQIEILKSKGLIVDDIAKAEKILISINYYVFSGYLFDFKKEDGKYHDINFNTIYRIYQCDKRLKSIMLYAIEIIEHNIKTKIAYYLATAIDPLAYLDSKNFISAENCDKTKSLFEKAVDSNKHLPFVQHHIKNYGGKFPVWVAIELFTLGMTKHLYANLKTTHKKQIAKYFNTGIAQLESWIDCVSYIRNLAAHNMRLYNFNTQKSPKICKHLFHNSFKHSYKIYDIIYVMQFLVPNKNEWNNYILSEIKSTFDEYENSIDLSCYGFPDNWASDLHIS